MKEYTNVHAISSQLSLLQELPACAYPRIPIVCVLELSGLRVLFHDALSQV